MRILMRNVAAILLAGAPLLAGVEPAWGQLSGEDIAALQRRAAAERWTFTVAENPATRRPLHELCGAVEPANWRRGARFDPCEPRGELPEAWDWREHNGCTPIRNQRSCGSCWAFAAIGTFESAILINETNSVDLSEQWLVSCTNAGNCIGGGWHTQAYEFLRCNGRTDPCGDGGAVLEKDFPYVAWNAHCGCPYPHPYCLDSWVAVGSRFGIPSPEQVKQAIFDHGPVSTCVYVNSAFSAYNGGVFNACQNNRWLNGDCNRDGFVDFDDIDPFVALLLGP